MTGDRVPSQQGPVSMGCQVARLHMALQDTTLLTSTEHYLAMTTVRGYSLQGTDQVVVGVTVGGKGQGGGYVERGCDTAQNISSISIS